MAQLAPKWHGWASSRLESQLHVGPVPGRRQITLSTSTDTKAEVLAFFVSPETAAQFQTLMDAIWSQLDLAVHIQEGAAAIHARMQAAEQELALLKEKVHHFSGDGVP